MDRSGVENLVGTASTPYGKATYWSDRYTKDTDQFDWYQRYAGIKSILAKYAKKKGAILDVGCGNSRLGEDMVNDGYANVRCVDNCAVVVEQMSAKYGALGGLTFGRDDARTLESVADGSVDCVVDKGTLDAVLCGEDSREGSAQLLAAALRVLKKKGVLLIVSHSKARAALIPPGAWKVATHDVAAPALDDAKPATTHYVYACTKIA